VASAQPNEGKSTTVMSLAYYMASIGKKVLVVDTDINRPSIHGMTGIRLQKGFSDLVTDNAKLLDVIHRDAANKVDVICAGSTKMLSPELWQSESSQSLINLMKAHYDFVLFDSPPLLALSDASALASLMDNVLVVAEWSKTAQKKVTHIISQLESFSKPVLGVILTKVKVHQYATYDHGEAGIYYGANARYYANA
jgi:capsular exopolysaccharide synthesis family protein